MAIDSPTAQQIAQLNQRVTELETTICFQDDTLEVLNQTIGEQYQKIQHLQHQIKLLSELIKNIKTDTSTGIKIPSEETPPPHY